MSGRESFRSCTRGNSAPRVRTLCTRGLVKARRVADDPFRGRFFFGDAAAFADGEAVLIIDDFERLLRELGSESRARIVETHSRQVSLLTGDPAAVDDAGGELENLVSDGQEDEQIFAGLQPAPPGKSQTAFGDIERMGWFGRMSVRGCPLDADRQMKGVTDKMTLFCDRHDTRLRSVHYSTGLLLMLAVLGSIVGSAIARETLTAVSWEQLSDRRISDRAAGCLKLMPESEWMHSESERFVVHYTDAEEARTVYINAEIYYGWISKMLGLDAKAAARKIHVFVFTDEKVWDEVLAGRDSPHQADAFTDGDELFIKREPYWLSPMKTMAHETAHVVLFRTIGRAVPLCFNEGFAEYISWKALAMQQGRSEFDLRVVQLVKPDRYIPLRELLTLKTYPEGERVKDFYTQSELLVRYLLLERQMKTFQALLRRTAAGEDPVRVLSDLIEESFEEFEETFRRYATTGKTVAEESQR